MVHKLLLLLLLFGIKNVVINLFIYKGKQLY